MINYVCPHCQNTLFLVEEHLEEDPYCPFCWLPVDIEIEQFGLYEENLVQMEI